MSAGLSRNAASELHLKQAGLDDAFAALADHTMEEAR